jgi:hypothetical protein
MKKLHTLCGTRPRAWAELQSMPTIIRFHYPCGYSQLVNTQTDRKLREIAPALLRRWTLPGGYWTKDGGGVVDECPRCRRLAMKELRLAKAL